MRDVLAFYINGSRREVRGPDATQTLTDYLRAPQAGACGGRLVGTKVACAEGDCGACTVLVGRLRPDGAGFDYAPVDACIAFVFQVDRCHVVTVEGVAAADGALSPVQQAMVDCHGSQCGFCTPGFVMALHGMVERRPDGEDAPLGDDALRLGLSGNLCRCTGYWQILEAGASLAPGRVPRLAQRYDTAAMAADLAALPPEAHVNAQPVAGLSGANGHAGPRSAAGPHPAEVFLPASLESLLKRRAERPDARLVAGATDLGVQRNHGSFAPSAVMSTAGIAALRRLEREGDELVIGASATWDGILEFVRGSLPEYAAVLERFGSPQVRRMGTLAGNVANASPIADSLPLHFVTGTRVVLASTAGRREVPIDRFYLAYKKTDLRPEEVIVELRTPLPGPNQRLKLYKVSKRRDMDISTVTAAFLLTLDGDRVVDAAIAFGGVGPTVARLPGAEGALRGRPFTLEAARAAGGVARGEVTPISDVRGAADHRLRLVANLFEKCWHDLRSPQPEPPAVVA